MHTIYQWQQAQWQYLSSRIAHKTFPHALLLEGQSGLGKSDFALTLAKFLLCEENLNAKGDEACGNCKSCKLIAANNHPDFYLLQPNADGKIIKIEQIREVIAAITTKSHQHGYQVIIINPADNMHIAASNALLKTLEEPSSSAIFILVTNRPSALPATILSRCQRIKFYPPNKETTAAWLQQKINNSNDLLLTLPPLEALNLASDENQNQRHNLFSQLTLLLKRQLDPLSFANSFIKMDLKLLLNYLHSWFMDLLRLKFNLAKEFITNNDYLENLQNLSKEINTKKLLNCLDKIIALHKYLDNNLNQQLLLEDLGILIIC